MVKRSQQQWQQVIEAQRSSGLTIVQFCKTHKINPSTFYAYRKKCTNMPAHEETSQWLPLETILPEVPDTKQWQIELRLPNGVVLNMSTEG
jgi:hypothetical protein